MRTALPLIVLAALPGAVTAAEWHLHLGGWSSHQGAFYAAPLPGHAEVGQRFCQLAGCDTPPEHVSLYRPDSSHPAGWAETHQGLALEVVLERGVFASLGVFKDSFGHDAFQAGVGRRWLLAGGDGWSIEGGAYALASYRQIGWRSRVEGGEWIRDSSFGDYTWNPGREVITPELGWVAGIIPVLTSRIGRTSLNLSYLPRMDSIPGTPITILDLSFQVW